MSTTDAYRFTAPEVILTALANPGNEAGTVYLEAANTAAELLAKQATEGPLSEEDAGLLADAGAALVAIRVIAEGGDDSILDRVAGNEFDVVFSTPGDGSFTVQIDWLDEPEAEEPLSA